MLCSSPPYPLPPRFPNLRLSRVHSIPLSRPGLLQRPRLKHAKVSPHSCDPATTASCSVPPFAAMHVIGLSDLIPFHDERNACSRQTLFVCWGKEIFQ